MKIGLHRIEKKEAQIQIHFKSSQIYRSTNVVGPLLVCQQCDTTLHGFAEFGCHMRTHLISEDCEQKCNLCHATFTDPIVQLFSFWIMKEFDAQTIFAAIRFSLILQFLTLRMILHIHNVYQLWNILTIYFHLFQTRISHIVEHFMENSIHVQCRECPTESFYNFQQIRQHHSDAHLEILYRCAICHQIFNSQHRFQVQQFQNVSFRCNQIL